MCTSEGNTVVDGADDADTGPCAIGLRAELPNGSAFIATDTADAVPSLLFPTISGW